MMVYSISLSKEAEEYLSKLDTAEEQKIIKRLELLKDNPFHFLERKGNSWVLKVGQAGYRLAIDVDKNKKEIEVLFIQRRSKFYQEYDVNK